MSDFDELKTILSELDLLFEREDDVKDVIDVAKMQREIEHQSQMKVKSSKELVKAMTVQLAKKESEITAPTKAEHAATLRKISEKENLQVQLDSMLKAIDSKRSNIARITDTCVTLQERAQEFKVDSHIADSRTAYSISLYSKVTNLTWDYNAAPGHLAGFVGNESKKELKSFDIDTRTMSSFEVANSLWEMIGKTYNNNNNNNNTNA